jgi:NAD(P)-dependent dehydrogenase (short-subunit alcohol dehydrogenase family)
MPERIALVTGANRGIGFEICRQLANAGIGIVMTARNAGKGQAAAKKLAGSGIAVTFRQLDVTSETAIGDAIAWMEQTYGRIDILVNNAGVMLDARGKSVLELDASTLRDTLETNLVAPLRLSQAAILLMRQHRYGRIVNLSSTLGQLAAMGSGTPAYRISKTALNSLTRVLAAENMDNNIKINSMHPGWVRTDMGGTSAPKSVAEGADTAVWLATLPDDGPTGGFFSERKPIPW